MWVWFYLNNSDGHVEVDMQVWLLHKFEKKEKKKKWDIGWYICDFHTTIVYNI